MSWQGMSWTHCHDYWLSQPGWVDQTLVGSNKIDKAAIFSAAGDAEFASTPGFDVSFWPFITQGSSIELGYHPTGSARRNRIHPEGL